MGDVDPSRCVDFDEVVECAGNTDFLIIDVRQPNELKEAGAIEGSVNIPAGEINEYFRDGPAALQEKLGRRVAEDGGNIIFHCKMGGRATRAALAADEFGFKNARVYKGSFKDWLDNGGAVIL